MLSSFSNDKINSFMSIVVLFLLWVINMQFTNLILLAESTVDLTILLTGIRQADKGGD